MAIILTSTAQKNASPCDHYTATVQVDLTQNIAVDICSEELSAPLTKDDIEVVLKAWVRYQRSKGVLFSALLNKTVFPDLL